VSKRFGVIEDEETEESARQKIVIAAQAMLDGTLSFIQGARTIVWLSFPAKIHSDKDIRPFVGIESETDAFPFGDVREHWKPEALNALRPEIEAAEQWARETGNAHCRNLIRRFS